MTLKLPDFRGRKCVEIDFCGVVRSEAGKELSKFQAIEDRLVASYRGAEHEITVGLIPPFPGNLSKVHVHLHFLVGELSEKKRPQLNATTDQILARLEPLLDSTVRVELEAVFRIPQTDFPSFIRSTLIETNADDVQVRMIGGTLAVRGVPVHTISWRLAENGARADVVFEALTRLKFDESYFEKGLDLVEPAAMAFIPREGRNA